MNCSIHSETCAREHTVYWSMYGLGEVYSGIIKPMELGVASVMGGWVSYTELCLPQEEVNDGVFL